MKSFTESGVLFPDDWENEPEEPAVPPPAPEPKPERKVRDTAARPAPKLASEDEDLDYGTPCFKRADLVDLLCEEHGFDVAESRAFVAEFFDMIFDHLVQGHMVKLSGLGRFSVRYKAPRPAGTLDGRNGHARGAYGGLLPVLRHSQHPRHCEAS